MAVVLNATLVSGGFLLASGTVLSGQKLYFEGQLDDFFAQNNITPTANQKDAMRHAYVSAKFSQLYGEDFAALLGYLNEEYTEALGYNNPADKGMDLFNNRVGREYATANPSITNEDLISDLWTKLGNNELIPSPSDPRASDYNYVNEEQVQIATDFYDELASYKDDVNDYLSEVAQVVVDPLDQLIGSAANVIHNLHNAFSNPLPWKDPLTLDMDRDGNIDLRGLESGVIFDLDENDYLERVGWVKAEDGMLARDLNSNGTIDSQSELFGNSTTSGFAMLTALDSNSDNVINNLDTDWNTLLVWQDANQDGIGQSNELVTLDAAGIVSISLNTSPVNSVVAGNVVTNQASITWSDTGTSYAWDVNLMSDSFYSKYTGEYELNPEVLFLPTARGYGLLADLHIAMSENETLLEKVKDFAELSLTDYRAVQKAVLDILVDWSGADEQGTHPDYVSGETLPSEYIHLIDAIRGMAHVNHIGNEIVGMMLDKYIQMIASRLLVETHFKDVLPNLSYNINEDKFEGTVDYEDLVDRMLELAPTTVGQSTLYWRDMIAMLNEIGAGLGTAESVYKDFVIDAMAVNEVPFTYDQVQDMNEFSAPGHGNYFRNATDGEGQFYSLAQSSSYSGQSSSTSGDDIIIGLPGGETSITIHGGARLNGGDGNDTIYGTFFNDVIYGGGGQNTIYGYEGSDEINVAGSDTVYAGNHDDLITVMSAGLTTALHGEDGDDMITGNTGVDTIYGGAGEDTINGGGGQDSLYGGDDDDWIKGVNAAAIYGDAGNDTLIGGGVSNQALYGGDGNDILSFDPVTNRLAEIYQYGGNGNDTLNIVSAINYLDGGAGDDLYNWTITGYTNQPFGIFITDASGFDRLDINGQNISYGLDRVDDDLYIYFGNNTLTIEGQFSNPSDLVIDEIWHAWSSTLIDMYSWTPVSGSTLTGTNSAETITGTNYSDFIYGLNGHDTLNGNAGHDYLEGGAGQDTLNGGGQNDILVGGLGNDSLRGGAGNDTYRFQVGDGQDTIAQEDYTESLDDVIEFTDSTTWSDLNFGLSGLGLVIYYGSTDYITIQNQYTSVSGGVTVISQTAIEHASFSDESSYSLTNGVGVHSIGGSTVINQTYTGIPEYVYASTQADTLYMMAGNDTVYGRAGNDYVDGGDGHDWLYGEDGDDTLYGGDGNDRLYGGNNNDALYGGAGNDRLSGGAGTDTLTGGTGDDVYVVDDALETLVENADEGIDTVESSVNFTLGANLENLTLTASTRTGTGNDLDNILIGYGGTTNLYGGNGNDTLIGGTGVDTLYGGTGNDTFIVNATTDSIVEYSGEGTDSVQSSATYTLSANVENLTLIGTFNINGTGNDNANIITGNSGNNSLNGYGGNDVLYGGAGNDSLNGGVDDDVLYGEDGTDSLNGSSGNDILYGGAGNDTLNGLSENDTLYGGDGLDSMTGGTGADTFVFEADSAFNNIDTISDFNTGQSDKLDISDLLIGYSPGTSDINDFMSLSVAGGNTTVLIDRDGTGGSYSSQSVVTLTSVTGLDVDDLLNNGNLIV